eukprot:gene5632-10848_t
MRYLPFFIRDLRKGVGKSREKGAFKRRTVIKPITSRFQSPFSLESPSPKKLSPKRGYRGFAKQRRLEMIAELVKREEATANHDHGKQTSIVLMSDAGIDPAESELSLGVEDEIRHNSTQQMSPANELFMASNAETQIPIVWNFKGTQF